MRSLHELITIELVQIIRVIAKVWIDNYQLCPRVFPLLISQSAKSLDCLISRAALIKLIPTRARFDVSVVSPPAVLGSHHRET